MKWGVLVFRARLGICVFEHLPYYPHVHIGVVLPRSDSLLRC